MANKLRIKHHAEFDGGHIYRFWTCTDGRFTGFGGSPYASWLAWKLKAEVNG